MFVIDSGYCKLKVRGDTGTWAQLLCNLTLWEEEARGGHRRLESSPVGEDRGAPDLI